MATLPKKTIQRLAVLRAVSMWKTGGAYGPLRVQKTLFFADRDSGSQQHLFTFKRWRLGQYSDEIADAMNGLRDASRIETVFDGPSECIRASLSPRASQRLERFFRRSFPAWSRALKPAFQEWAYLTNDDIIAKAHEDDSYTKSQHGEVIVTSFEQTKVDFPDLDPQEAEFLSDLVDERFQRGLASRLETAASREPKREDWREFYGFAKKRPPNSA